MSDQLIGIFWLNLGLSNFWCLIIYFYSFFHIFFLKSHQLFTFLYAGHFVNDTFIDACSQLLKGVTIAETKQYICFNYDDFDDFLFVLLLDASKLRRTSYQNSLWGQMIDFFHIQVENINFGQSWYEIMNVLGELFGMADEW